jgi:hypothetical protein
MRPLLSISCRLDPKLANLIISKDDRRLPGQLTARDIMVPLVCEKAAAYECSVRLLVQRERPNPYIRAWVMPCTTAGLVRVARSQSDTQRRRLRSDTAMYRLAP